LEWVTEEELNIILDYEEIREPGVEGYSAGGRIVIRTSLSPTAKAGVVAHELAHELLHKKDKQPDSVTKTKQQRELEAEAIANVVMRHFGIEHVACNSSRLTKSMASNSTNRSKPSVQRQNT
jgi:hypothetical protein